MEEFNSVYKDQLAQIPTQYHFSLYNKIKNEIFDASDFNLEFGELRAISTIDDIYLVDHAWTVASYNQVERDAKSIPGLVSRFRFDNHKIDMELVKIVMEATLVAKVDAVNALIDSDWQTLDAIQILTESSEQREGRESLETALGHHPGSNIGKTVTGFWNFCSFYKSGNYNLWYITDEVGLAIQHSENPNVKMIPFLTVKDGMMIAYSVFWPITVISEGDLISRDAIPVALTDKIQRDIYSNIVFNTLNESQMESTRAFKNFESRLPRSDTLKRAFSEPTDSVDFYIIQKLVLSKYGNVSWISRMYQLPFELSEWNGHYLSDNECAWEIFDGSEQISTQNHPFLIHQLDLGNIIYFKKVEKELALYGGRRFTLDFLVKISGQENLELSIADNFFTRIADEPDTLDHKWKNSVLKTKIWTDTEGKPTPSPQVFLKNYGDLPLKDIMDGIKCTIDAWNPKVDMIYMSFQLKKDNSPILTDVGLVGDMDVSEYNFQRIKI